MIVRWRRAGIRAASLTCATLLCVGTQVRAADENEGAAKSVESGMERAGAATKHGLDTAGEATGEALEKAMEETGDGIGYAIEKTGEGFQDAGDAMAGPSPKRADAETDSD